MDTPLADARCITAAAANLLGGDAVHAAAVKRVSAAIAAADSRGVRVTTLKPSLSHNPYNELTAYKAECEYVDICDLNRVLHIDASAGYVLVDGSAQLGDICTRTLAQSLLPPVVCEFADFTVGGLIAGLGMQSSSHKYGFWHDTLLAMEVVLGDGRVLWLTRHDVEHSDLFHNLPGSMGTLGIVTAAVITLIPAKRFVLSRYLMFNDVASFQAAIAANEGRAEHEFMEGIVYAPDACALVLSRFADEAEVTSVQQYDAARAGEPYYHQHVEEMARLTRQRGGHESVMALPVLSYLFRYQRGIWWLLEAYVGLHAVTRTRCGRRMLDDALASAHSKATVEIQSLRGSGGKGPREVWQARLTQLQKESGELTREDSTRCIVTQGFAVRTNGIARMLGGVHEKLQIYPIWVCGARAVLRPENYSQRAWTGVYGDARVLHVYDVGAYGEPMAASFKSFSSVRALQSLCDVPTAWGMTYMTDEEVARLIDFESYHALRRKYRATRAFMDFMSKVRSGKGAAVSASRDLPKVFCWRCKRAKLYTPMLACIALLMVLAVLLATYFALLHSKGRA